MKNLTQKLLQNIYDSFINMSNDAYFNAQRSEVKSFSDYQDGKSEAYNTAATLIEQTANIYNIDFETQTSYFQRDENQRHLEDMQADAELDEIEMVFHEA